MVSLDFVCELEGKGGEGFGRKKCKEQVEEIDDIERGKFWGFIFLHSTKSFSFRGTQIVSERVLGGLHEFFKFNVCSYNILKIKNILIISINLSFSKKLLLHKM